MNYDQAIDCHHVAPFIGNPSSSVPFPFSSLWTIHTIYDIHFNRFDTVDAQNYVLRLLIQSLEWSFDKKEPSKHFWLVVVIEVKGSINPTNEPSNHPLKCFSSISVDFELLLVVSVSTIRSSCCLSKPLPEWPNPSGSTQKSDQNKPLTLNQTPTQTHPLLCPLRTDRLNRSTHRPIHQSFFIHIDTLIPLYPYTTRMNGDGWSGAYGKLTL